MADQRVADVGAGAGQHVDDTGREDLGQDLGEGQRAQWRPGRWLEHGRVAGRQRGAELPGGHVERVVPRRDRGHDPDRVAPDDRGMAGHELVGGQAVHHPRGAGEEAEQVDAHADLVDGGTDRLAGVGALEPPELFGPSLERIGQLEQQQRAILRRRLLPGLEGGRGRPDGAIHVLGRAGRDIADGLVVGGVDDVRRPAVGGIHELATDELLVGLDALEGVGHWGASWVIHRSAGSSAVHRSAGRSVVPPRAPRDAAPHRPPPARAAPVSEPAGRSAPGAR